MKHENLSHPAHHVAWWRLFWCLAAFAAMPLYGQQTRSLKESIRSVRVVADDDPLLPPVSRLGGKIRFSFDAMTHEYVRYMYKVEYCNADWTPADDVFESDWLAGFNNMPIEDYATSLNTSILYTHYLFSLPNADTRLLLPGNYRVLVYPDDGDVDDAVLEACFSLVSPAMTVAATVSPNTDVDFNQSHQQVTWSLGFGECSVIDPDREIHTVVMQNRRFDNAVRDLPPNIRRTSGVEWTHRRELIFDAGNEYHKFELLDVRRGGMGVDRMVWKDPIYHAELFSCDPPRSYTYAPDANGAWVVRRSGAEDADTEAEYVIAHFSLHTPRLPGGDVYVTGLWDDGFPDPRCRMEYDERRGQYEVGVLLKQGYYNYQFLQLDEDGTGRTARTDGNFYETRNEYVILVYHRPQGARYDALVAYQRILTK